MATRTSRRLIIHGRVQGVFFRDWTVKAAREIGLAGWVRNCGDGTVEALVEGERGAVERFVALAAHGPAAADVERIEQKQSDPSGLTDFERH